MGSDDEIPALRPDSSDEESEADEPEPRVEKYPQHQPQAPFRTKPAEAAHDPDDEIPELLEGDSEEDDDEEPPPLVGSEEEDDSEDDVPSNKNGHGPNLPGLKAGFFAKPKGQRAAPPPTPATSAKPAPPPKAAPKPAQPPKPAPAAQEKTASQAKSAPPPAAKPAKGGQVEDGSDSEDVPDLLEANEDDEDSGLEDSAEDSEGDQEANEQRAYPQGFTGARGRNFYPNFEEEERAAEERRKREAERKRREEERAKERQARKQKELEEKRRRRAEAKARAAQDAYVYENSPEARELAEQARLRAEAEFEKKREQMGLVREKAGNEDEDFIGDAYVCRGSHCPGNQRQLTKTMEYIEYRCTERCLLLYHTGDCHRKDVKLKMEREHGVWKEEEGAPCITPDCPGTLTKGTKWNRFGKVSYQIIDPEKYEKKRREKERQRAEDKAAKQAAKQVGRSRKRDKPEEEENNAGRKARSRTFTTLSFAGSTEHAAPAEPIPEEVAQTEAAKEHKAETEEAPKKKGRRRNAEGGQEAENGPGPSGKQDEASGSGGAKPGITVLVSAPLKIERMKDKDQPVTEYRKQEDEDTVFTLGNKQPVKDKGKRKIDAVPEPTVLQKGKSKNKRVNILDFITSDDPEPAQRPPQPYAHHPMWLGPNGRPPRAMAPVVQRPVQEEFPELHKAPGAPSAAPPAPLFQGRPKDPFMLALDSIRLHDQEPTPHLVLEDVDSRADDDEVRQLFWEYGIVEQLTRFKAKDIAFVTMSSVQEATTAVLLLRNKSLRTRKIKPDSVTMHPTPAFFASFQPRQWVGVEHHPPAFAPNPHPQANFYDDFGGGEQWEEFEWSATGGDAFPSNDWGGNPGGSSSSFGAKREIRPDAPEFVPKSVLLAQQKKEPTPQASSTKEASGVSEAGGISKVAPAVKADVTSWAETMSQESVEQSGGSPASEVSQRPASAGNRGKVLKDERPSSAPQVAQVQASDGAETRPASAPKIASKEREEILRPKSAPKTRKLSKDESETSGLTSASTSGKEGEVKRPTSAPSKKPEEARQSNLPESAEKQSFPEMESARDSLLGAPPKLESAGEALRSLSASPVQVPPSLQAVRAGGWPHLTKPAIYAMGLVIATDNATLGLYKESIRLETVRLSLAGQPTPPIAPHTCALFLLNVDTSELHGYYEAISAACLPQEDPYTRMMYLQPQPHVAFQRKAACPAPLSRSEVEPIFPRGWWNVPSWQLPLLLPSMQAQMLIQLLGDKAEYETRKRQGSSTDLENGQALSRPLSAASSASIVDEVLASILSSELLSNPLGETAAVPAMIAAAAKASEKLKGKEGEQSSSSVTEASSSPSNTEASSEKSETAKPLFSVLAELPGVVSPSKAEAESSKGAAPRLQSLSSPLSPEASPSSPGQETTKPHDWGARMSDISAFGAALGEASTSKPNEAENKSMNGAAKTGQEATELEWGAPAVSDILAEISAAASGEASTSKPNSEESSAAKTENDPVEAEQAPSTNATEAAPNMQSILDMLLPKAASVAAPPPPPVSAAPPVNPGPPPAFRPYRPPVKYNPLGPSNGRVSTPPAARESPPLVDERTACKLCWVRKADFFLKECGHMGPCLLCHEDPRIDTSKCPQCSRAIAMDDPAKFIRMFR